MTTSAGSSETIKVFRYKNQYYVYLDVIQHKNPVTRAWDVVALYQDVEGNVYTRGIEEFYQKFTEVHTDEIERARSLIYCHTLQAELNKVDLACNNPHSIRNESV